jgi:hypothetical protein
VLGDAGEVDRVEVPTHLRQRLVGDGDAELALGFGEGEPEPAPQPVPLARRPEAEHRVGGVTLPERDA